MRYYLILLILFTPTIVSTAPITVGVSSNDYYPHYDFSNNRPRGYLYELLTEFEKVSPYQIQYKALPVKRLHHSFFETNEIDVLYPYNPVWHPKQDNSLSYSKAVMEIIGTTLVRPDTVGNGISAFKKLAVTSGFAPTQWYEVQKKQSIEIVETVDATTALKLVIIGRVDGADVEYNVAQYLLSKIDQVNKLTVDPELPCVSIQFKMVTRQHQKFITDFNNFLQSHSELVSNLKSQFNIVESLPVKDGKVLEIDNPCVG